MTSKHGISRLLHELKQLYLRVCDNDLGRRLGLYTNSSNVAPDISDSFSEHLNKLTPATKQNNVDTSNSETKKDSKSTYLQRKPERSHKKHHSLVFSIKALFHGKKIFTPLKNNDPYLGEKLKESTWSHIHAAQLHARQGNKINAKLHAGIANEALKEAANFMTENDYKVLCDEIASIFKQLEPK